MNKSFFILLSIIIPILVNAQDKSKYLAGAVPEIEQKVVFSKTVNLKNQVSEADLFDLMNKWADDNYNNSKADDLDNRVVLSNKDNKKIACLGEKYLIFKRSAFVLDRTKMMYQLILSIGQNKCDITVRSVKYAYPDSPDPLPAEDMITDKVAINKKGDKLNKYYDKFRTQTVDSVNSIFNKIEIYLNGTAGTSGIGASAMSTNSSLLSDSAPVSQQNQESSNSAMPGYRQVAADKIPGNIVKLLDEAMLITSGSGDQMNVMTASWGGLGRLWETPVAFCFLNPTRYSVQTMDKGEAYTISFYTQAYKDALTYCGTTSGRASDKIKGSGLTPVKTPSGATAFSEAWMIFECKKIVGQQLSADAVIDKKLSQEWSKDGYHKMYIGEILNVWIK